LPRRAPQAAARGKRAPRSRAKAKAVGGAGEAALGARLQAAVGGRDVGLGPFHALGKLLYNKRLAAGDVVRTRACGVGVRSGRICTPVTCNGQSLVLGQEGQQGNHPR